MGKRHKANRAVPAGKWARAAAGLWEWIKTVYDGFMRNHCTIHAAGLTYFSILALVPVLCLLLLLAKTCGVDRYARREINRQLDQLIVNVETAHEQPLVSGLPLMTAANEEELERKRVAAREFGVQARRVSDELFNRIEKFDVGTLGWLGFVLLIWTVISSLGMVETSFNSIWEVEKPRAIWRRAIMYLFICIVLPVLLALAASLPVINTARQVVLSVSGNLAWARALTESAFGLIDSAWARNVVSLVFMTLAFAWFLKLIPNCRVRFRPALYGGALTAVFFALWLKLCAIAQVGIANSSALYGSFALMPIVLAWMYVSWQIVLLGANMAHAFQVRAGSDSGV